MLAEERNTYSIKTHLLLLPNNEYVYVHAPAPLCHFKLVFVALHQQHLVACHSVSAVRSRYYLDK